MTYSLLSKRMLREAAEDFESGRLRWKRGLPCAGEACLFTSIAWRDPKAYASYGDREIAEAKLEACDAINDALSRVNSGDSIMWNDRRARGVEDVIGVLRAAHDGETWKGGET